MGIANLFGRERGMILLPPTRIFYRCLFAPLAVILLLGLTATSARRCEHRESSPSRSPTSGSQASRPSRCCRHACPIPFHWALCRAKQYPALPSFTPTQAPLSARSRLSRRTRGRRHIFFNPWTESTYGDSTVGDNVDGEDLTVRKAAVDALGPYNGTVIVADSRNGRVLSMVNQKLALKGAYQPLFHGESHRLTRLSQRTNCQFRFGHPHFATLFHGYDPRTRHVQQPLFRALGPGTRLRARRTLRQTVRFG